MASAAGWGVLDAEGGGAVAAVCVLPCSWKRSLLLAQSSLVGCHQPFIFCPGTSQAVQWDFQPGCCRAQHIELAETGCINSLFSRLALAAL